MLQRNGPYVFGKSEFERGLGERELREARSLKSGSVYLGEWLVDTDTREGKGK